MNEQLVVKNFGPIKDATVDFKRVTVFIGPTGGGKSTLAKLAAVFREFSQLGHEEQNREFLNFYQIKSFVQPNSKANWDFKGFGLSLNAYKLLLDDNFNKKLQNEIRKAHEKLLKQGSFPSLKELMNAAANEKTGLDNQIAATYRGILSQLVRVATAAVLPIDEVHYIPAERVYAPAISGALAGLMRDDLNLPKPLLAFVNEFITAKHAVQNLSIPFLNIAYYLRGDDDVITHEGNESELVLNQTASGIQSVTPLLVLLEHLSRNTEQAQSFIIEEPELNLYPTAQQGLLNWLVEKCTKGENDLTITTHSPYILSHLNLLLYAYQVAEKHPERKEAVADIVPEASWINPAEFACYQVENGGVTSLVNAELGLIDDNGLDNLSGDAADAFDNLIRLSKAVALK